MNKWDTWLSQIKKRKIAFWQTVQNLSYWNRYFVIYPHKCTLNNLKKRYQVKWENAYLGVKNARASWALRQALDLSQYWLTSLTPLRFTTSAKSRKTFWSPSWPNPGSASDMICDPHECPFIYSGNNSSSSRSHFRQTTNNQRKSSSCQNDITKKRKMMDENLFLTWCWVLMSWSVTDMWTNGKCLALITLSITPNSTHLSHCFSYVWDEVREDNMFLLDEVNSKVRVCY